MFSGTKTVFMIHEKGKMNTILHEFDTIPKSLPSPTISQKTTCFIMAETSLAKASFIPANA